MTLRDTKSRVELRRGSSTYPRWRLSMLQSRLFRPGDRVGVAVSGGPDSTLLLHFMLDFACEAGLTLAVAHFNHQLRGTESDEDEDFVGALARRFNLEFLCDRARVMELARARKANIEAAGRKLRYGFFVSLLNQGRLDKVATAHTANDQAETVLLRLMRGTGTRGLGGIHPVLEVPGGEVVRPFLGLTRAEVETEIARRGIAFRTDATNLNANLARNRVRQQVLPLLSRSFNPDAVRALAGFADRARDDESFLEGQARQRASEILVRSGRSLRVKCELLSETPSAVATRVLRQALEKVRTQVADASARCGLAVTHRDIQSVRHLATVGRSGARLQLAGGIEARREFEWVVIDQARDSGVPLGKEERRGFSYTVQPPSEVWLPELGLRLRFCVTDMCDTLTDQTAYNRNNWVWLDPSRLGAPFVLRNWRPGDRVDLSSKSLKLKDLFQRRRIPIAQRLYWPVLEANGEIIWARGFEAPFGHRPPSRCRLLISEEQYQPDFIAQQGT